MKEFIEKLIGRLEEKKSEHLHDEEVTQGLGRINLASFCSAKARALDGAIQIVNQLAAEYADCYKDCGNCEAYDKEKHHCPKFCMVIKDALAEMEGNKIDWIPCGEQMPILTAYYLVTIKGFSRPMYAWWISTEKKWYYLNSTKEIQDVTAWQPLPAPYQPKGE